MHVTIDGFGGNPQLLANEERIRDLLDRYPAQIGMTKIAPPFTYRYVGVKPLDWGISGFVLIAESHISIHTFPEYRHVWVDIFSCKGFDADRAVADMKEAFELAEVEVRILERGLEYPHSIRASVPLMHRERAEAAEAIGARAREGAAT
ncbi:MAG TPA: S-adenosylmethionine decarboxylase [Dehalococcoidia bacterium]|nr:S-adenosylmethionine decarboxylase [Dehalococcoidia bacterium]